MAVRSLKPKDSETEANKQHVGNFKVKEKHTGLN